MSEIRKKEIIPKRNLPRYGKPTLWQDLKNNKGLAIMCIPTIIFLLVFCYVPMFGLYIAFVQYDPLKGIWGSKFIGLENFRFFFESGEWVKITVNTLGLNILFILTGLIASVSIAIMLSEVSNKVFKKITQSVVILPHFMSWTVVALFSVALLSSDGMFNQIIKFFGGEGIKFYNDPKVWPGLLTGLRIWQGAGFGSIVYLAAITGIDQEMYEAAKMDGATRWQCIIKITLPLLKNTIVMLTIMSVGKIFYGDFGMIYAMVGNNTLLYPTTDVIDTYVYRSLMELGDMGMSSAVGFIQSILGFIFVVGSNFLAKKVSPESALF
ncbi:MAG: ABC transporter permease subunit [Oscillospiraceae bacterium]